MDKKSNEDSIKLSKGETKFYKIQWKLKKKKKEYTSYKWKSYDLKNYIIIKINYN